MQNATLCMNISVIFPCICFTTLFTRISLWWTVCTKMFPKSFVGQELFLADKTVECCTALLMCQKNLSTLHMSLTLVALEEFVFLFRIMLTFDTVCYRCLSSVCPVKRIYNVKDMSYNICELFQLIT